VADTSCYETGLKCRTQFGPPIPHPRVVFSLTVFRSGYLRGIQIILCISAYNFSFLACILNTSYQLVDH
jgi:hypothetical protein